tara:strand:+ start:1602 stop:1991 length:390 start_codon:yes stop_codon:yes gene_type:complete
MAIQQLFFNNPINSQVQVGDNAYLSGHNIGTAYTHTPMYIGKIIEINPNSLLIDSVMPAVINLYASGVNQNDENSQAFIFFAKPIEVNKGSLKGYYADVTLTNSADPNTGAMKYVELFAISSEASLSSK